MIREEGLSINTPRRVVRSMSVTATAALVEIITGDTKVVHRGASDKRFISDDATVVLAAICA